MLSVQVAPVPQAGEQLRCCSPGTCVDPPPTMPKLLVPPLQLTSDVSCRPIDTVVQQEPGGGECYLHRPLAGDSPTELDAAADCALSSQQMSPSPTPLSDAATETCTSNVLPAIQQQQHPQPAAGLTVVHQHSHHANQTQLPSRLIADSVAQPLQQCSRPENSCYHGPTVDKQQQQGAILRQDTAYQETCPQARSRLPGHPSYFSSLGRPITYSIPRRRVWVHDVPLRWRRLRCLAPKAESGVDPTEVQFILQGGFWQPSSQGGAPAPEPQRQHAGASIAGLSRFMQAQLRILQQEADEVVQLLRIRTQRVTNGSQSTSSRSGSGPGILGWVVVRVLGLVCCCQATVEDEDDAEEEEVMAGLVGAAGSYSAFPGYLQSQGPLAGASPGLQLQEAADRELLRRVNKRGSNTRAAYNVLRWGRGDPLRTPLLPRVSSDHAGPRQTSRNA